MCASYYATRQLQLSDAVGVNGDNIRRMTRHQQQQEEEEMESIKIRFLSVAVGLWLVWLLFYSVLTNL